MTVFDFLYSHRVALSVTGTAVAQHLIGIAADSVPPLPAKCRILEDMGIQSLSGSLSQLQESSRSKGEINVQSSR